MQLTQEQFQYLLIAVFALFFLLFRVWQREKTLQDQTTKLQLKLNPQSSEAQVKTISRANQVFNQSKKLPAYKRTVKTEAPRIEQMDKATQRVEEKENGAMRRLNVYFNFNGHTFEAHEILGVPYGATWSIIHKRYQENKQNSPAPYLLPEAQRDLTDWAYLVLMQQHQVKRRSQDDT